MSKQNTPNWAMAPAGTTHAYTTAWRKVDGDQTHMWYKSEWLPVAAPCAEDYIAMPAREAELNRLADDLGFCRELSPADISHGRFTEHGFFGSEILERRRIRIEAGLIDADHTAAMDQMGYKGMFCEPEPVFETEAAKADRELGKELKVYSEPAPVEPEQSEWKDGLPPEGERIHWVSDKHGSTVITKVVAYNDDRSSVWLEGEAIVSTDEKWRFEPIQPEVSEREWLMDSLMAYRLWDGHPPSICQMSRFYDWLKSKDVDLSPLMAKDGES